jgi:hypothetical protein
MRETALLLAVFHLFAAQERHLPISGMAIA